MTFEKNRRAETIIYIVLWTMLFMAPVMSLFVRSTHTGIDFDWSEIFTVWKQYAVYFLVFLIHNHLMAPMLIYHQQKASAWPSSSSSRSTSATTVPISETVGQDTR